MTDTHRATSDQHTAGAGAVSSAWTAERQLELLRRFEPVVRWSEGERFFPAPVGPYLRACSLRARRGEQIETLVEAGQLTSSGLEAHRWAGPEVFLQFVQEPLRGPAAEAWQRARQGVVGSGLTRVGLFGRMIDAFFSLSLSLSLRGTVPAGTAAAAEARAVELGLHDQPTYYGRVVRSHGWIVLQYLYFYAMNDWRTSFGGANDHEGDWEQVLVYLSDDPDGEPKPAWAAYSSHDHVGDDLRRSWSDPELQRDGDHPIVFAGAGSHANYFSPGEYLTRVDIPLLRPVLVVQRWLKRLARVRKGHVLDDLLLLRVPFVDIADGAGRSAGVGGERPWSAHLLDPEAPWVADFRGLWGLDTADVTGGERAPAGPKYERDGSIRRSWADPVGWSGLHKVVPPPVRDEVRRANAAAAEADLHELNERIDDATMTLRGRALAASAPPYELERLEGDLSRLHQKRAALTDEVRRLRAEPPPPADAVDPRSHLRRPAVPEPIEASTRRLVNGIWAALSAPLILGTIALLIAEPLNRWLITLGIALGAMLGLEFILRGRLLTLGKVVVGVAVLWGIGFALLNWGRYALAGILALIAVVVLVGNVRELLRR